MTSDQVTSTAHEQDLLAGPRGNERLTAWAGAALFVLLAIEGVTILDMRALRWWHVVVGIVMVGPLVVKVGSTGYRFVRYYSGDAGYRASGPPHLALRVLAPFLVLATGVVFATGFALVVLPEWHRYTMERAHKASFLLWVVLAAVHVLAYVWRVPRLMARDVVEAAGASARAVAAPVSGSGWARVALLAVSGVAGLVLAKLLV